MQSSTIYVCDTCDTEIEGDFCENHPNDNISSVQAEDVKSDPQHYAEMRKFFNENLKDLEFEPMLPYCSQCGKKDPAYVGLMRCFERPSPLVFAFCIECRDDLVRRADAARQLPERFGV